MSFTDSHAHLTSHAVYEHIDALIERAKAAGVLSIVNICTDEETLRRGLSLNKKYPWIYNAAATTPHDVEKEGEALFPLMEFHACQGDLVAIGETGLDYHYHHSKPEVQQHFLKRYLKLALRCQLPVIIHCREAFEDLFKILDEHYTISGKHALGVLHCFTGSLNEAKEVLARGWYLSLSGIVTFKKSTELQEVAKMMPLDRLLIETDTPYLAPQSKRGKTNEPAFISETASFIAAIKEVPVEELASATTQNARRLFNF